MDMKRNAKAKIMLFLGLILAIIGYVIKFSINDNNVAGDISFFIFNIIGIILIFKAMHYNHGSIYFQNAKSNKVINKTTFIPKCPVCGSTNIEKINGINKIGKIVAFGIFATNSVSKTFHCKNCGYKF